MPQTETFKLLGGHPALDFMNTVGAWAPDSSRKGALNFKETPLRDKFNTYSDLISWNLQAGLLTDKEARVLLRVSEKQPKTAAEVARRAANLRSALRGIFQSVIDERRPDQSDIEQLNEELTIARSHQKVVSTAKRLEWTWDASENDLDRVLWTVAISGAELLLAGDLSRVRQCVGEECGWVFLDTSRNRSRQWCEMGDCGNLAKVRRFRQRQAEGA